MVSVRAYAFDECFSDSGPARPSAVAAVSDSGTLRVREDRARAEGFEAGRVAVREDAAARTAHAVREMAETLATALSTADRIVAGLSEDAAELAIAAADHLAGPAQPVRFTAHAKARIAAIVADNFSQPRITVSVAPAMQPSIQAAADFVVGETAFAGRVDVVADPALAAADLVIDWRIGMLRESRRDRLDVLAKRLTEYFATNSSQGET